MGWEHDIWHLLKVALCAMTTAGGCCVARSMAVRGHMPGLKRIWSIVGGAFAAGGALCAAAALLLLSMS